MLFSRAPLILEEFGSWANAPSPGMNLDAEIVGFGFYLLERFFLQAVISIEIGDQDRIEFQRSRVVEKRRSLPAHRADRKIIEAEAQLFCRGAGLYGCADSRRCNADASDRYSFHECP